MDISLIERLRIYFNYGAIGFFMLLFLLNATDAMLMVLIPTMFNLMLWRKLSQKAFKREGVIIGLVSGLSTTGVFVVQYNYYQQNLDWGCLKVIAEYEANVSYLTNLVLFSTVIWEIGIWASRKRIGVEI